MPFQTGRRIPSGQEMTQRMIRGVQNNADKWLDGTLHPTVSPKEAAIKANGKYKARMQEALAQDTWVKGVQAYNEDDAVDAITKAGTTAYVNGVVSRERKIQAKMEAYSRELEGHVAKMDSMPADNEAQIIAKMTENYRGMRAIGQRLKGATR